MADNWYDKWQEAHAQATFYKSEQNTIKYWDTVASSGSDGLLGTKHIEMLAEYLLEHHYIDETRTILDVGCGLGDYSMYFARLCKQMTAMDYSDGMLEHCKQRVSLQGIENVEYLLADIKEYDDTRTYDGVLACLNPSTYDPSTFSKLLKLAKCFVVYFSMDMSIENKEPIYCGTNSVRYAEKYLESQGISYTKLPYEYILKQKDNSSVHIPFAYLVIDVSGSKK